LLQFLPPDEDAPSSAGRFRAPANPVGPGERNRFLYRLSRSLKARGLSAAAILAAARVANAEQCAPPHEDEEVRRVVEHVWAQADRPGYGSLPATLTGPARAETLSLWARRGRFYGLAGEEIAALLLAMNRHRCQPPPLARAVVEAMAGGGAAADRRLTGPTTETVTIWVG
jgi:hypothetical protein